MGRFLQGGVLIGAGGGSLHEGLGRCLGAPLVAIPQRCAWNGWGEIERRACEGMGRGAAPSWREGMAGCPAADGRVPVPVRSWPGWRRAWHVRTACPVRSWPWRHGRVARAARTGGAITSRRVPAPGWAREMNAPCPCRA